MNNHLMKDKLQDTLFQSASAWINTEIKLCIVEQLNDIKLSRYHYVVNSIKYGSYFENMFALQNFAHKICNQQVNVIKPLNPTELHRNQ